MPRISRRPSPELTRPLIEFIKQYLIENKISLRKASARIGVNPSHLSRILSGEIPPDAGVCNQIADAFGVPRVRIYALAGWMKLESQEEQANLEKLRPSFDPDLFQDIAEIYSLITDLPSRKKFLQIIQELKKAKPGSAKNPSG
jgi:transcriptional regulator with XRE-family HTH domain